MLISDDTETHVWAIRFDNSSNEEFPQDMDNPLTDCFSGEYKSILFSEKAPLHQTIELSSFDNRMWSGCPNDLCSFAVDDIIHARFRKGWIGSPDLRYITNCQQAIIEDWDTAYYMFTGNWFYTFKENVFNNQTQIRLPRLEEARLMWQWNTFAPLFICRPWELFMNISEHIHNVDAAVVLEDKEQESQILMFFLRNSVFTMVSQEVEDKDYGNFTQYTVQKSDISKTFDVPTDSFDWVHWATNVGSTNRMFVASDLKLYAFEWEPKTSNFRHISLNWNLDNVPYLVQAAHSDATGRLYLINGLFAFIYEPVVNLTQTWNFQQSQMLGFTRENCEDNQLRPQMTELVTFEGVQQPGAPNEPLIDFEPETPTLPKISKQGKETNLVELGVSRIMLLIIFFLFVLALVIVLFVYKVSEQKVNQTNLVATRRTQSIVKPVRSEDTIETTDSEIDGQVKRSKTTKSNVSNKIPTPKYVNLHK